MLMYEQLVTRLLITSKKVFISRFDLRRPGFLFSEQVFSISQKRIDQKMQNEQLLFSMIWGSLRDAHYAQVSLADNSSGVITSDHNIRRASH